MVSVKLGLWITDDPAVGTVLLRLFAGKQPISNEYTDQHVWNHGVVSYAMILTCQ